MTKATPTRTTRTKQELKYYELAGLRSRALASHTKAKQREKDAKAALDAIEQRILDELKNDRQESTTTRGYNFTSSRQLIAEIKDRDDYLEYASLPENRDLLHKRISMEAARERWNRAIADAKAEGLSEVETAKKMAAAIPGVLPGYVPTLSVTKRAARGAVLTALARRKK